LVVVVKPSPSNRPRQPSRRQPSPSAVAVKPPAGSRQPSRRLDGDGDG
jgi:hypothetical protein